MRTALGVAWLSFYLVSLIGAANDIIAIRFHVPVESVTWAVRIGLFVVPFAAYVLTKRMALGLQRSDRDKVLHGRETGIIKRMPDGEFIEVHESLRQAQLHVLTQHEQYRPIGPGVRLSQQLRSRISEILYGEGAQITKPTVQEYQALHKGRTDDHA